MPNYMHVNCQALQNPVFENLVLLTWIGLFVATALCIQFLKGFKLPNALYKGLDFGCSMKPGRSSGFKNKPFVCIVSLASSFSTFFFFQSLDGFIFALNKEGRFLYISETVSIYLGLSQVSVFLDFFSLYASESEHWQISGNWTPRLSVGWVFNLHSSVQYFFFVQRS